MLDFKSVKPKLQQSSKIRITFPSDALVNPLHADYNQYTPAISNQVNFQNCQSTQRKPIPNDTYRAKYLELLNRQLLIIRQQADSAEEKETETVSDNILTKSQNRPKNHFRLGTVLGFWATTAIIPIILFWGIFSESTVYGLGNLATKQVAGVSEMNTNQIDYAEYNLWIKNLTGLSLFVSGDQDGDGLTNGEEFLLKTDPTNSHTCTGEKSDLDNLLSLVDPVSCQTLDLENADDLAKFDQVIHIPTIAQKMFAFQENSQTEEPVGSSLYEIFGVDDLNKINYSSKSELQKEIEINKKKEQYANVLIKIDQYISANRSYEEYDRDYPTPVSSAVFLETSIKYDVPLKYVLTVARLESRFGTDRYTKSGILTRPGAYQNMYSIGLDDSGNNKAYSSWEDGVYGFGRWYRYFDDKGISDCQKWRIYNPNGDYCAKVEAYASEIQIYIYGA